MTPERIEEIKALLTAATQGTWEVVNLGQIEIATNYRVENGMHVANWIAEMDVQEEDQEEQAGADAELIVAAVNSLPDLLDALEDVQQKLERSYNQVWHHINKREKAEKRLAEAQQTIATLSNYLKELRDVTSSEIIESQINNVLNEYLGNKEGEKTE